jgi:hypothetical protein
MAMHFEILVILAFGNWSANYMDSSLYGAESDISRPKAWLS